VTDYPQQLPEYDADGQEVVFYENTFRGIEEQTVEGLDCFNPTAPVYNDENLIVLKLTGQEFTEMFSALYFGAEFAYPSRFMQILVNFLKGIHCPPIMEDQECFEYLSYASFMQYSPANPYLTPDLIPDGYLHQPFLINGENGVDVPNYEHFDVIVPIDAITLDLDWFETIDGQLPTIRVMVQGEGKAYLKMLTVVAGGMAVITLDNPPDILDIIGGIVTGSDNIIDLNQDLVSLPPETAQELIFEVDIVGTGLHTIYIVFLPIIDDSLIPIRFGGGFRGVQLCNFVETPEMGLTAIRFQDCNLEQLIEGEWSIVSGWENWTDCFPDVGVQDIRYLDGVLQKQIDGVWTDVVDIDGLLAPIISVNNTQNTRLDNLEFSVNLLESSDAAQQLQIDDLELSVGGLNAQVGILDGRMNTAESDIDDLELSVAGLNATLGILAGNVDSLLARTDVLDFGGAWAWIHEFESTNGGYVAGTNGSYVASEGWVSNTNGLDMEQVASQIRENQVTHIKATVVFNDTPTGSLTWSVNGGESGLISYNGIGNDSVGWLRVRNENSVDFILEFSGAGDYTLKSLEYLGRGTDIPFD